MSTYEPVDLYFKDTSPQKVPVAGVVTRVTSQDGVQLYGMATSDGAGHTSFLLPSGMTFQARYYKFGTMLPNPQYLEIRPAPILNTFDVPVAPLNPPVPTDARLCTAFGFFRDITGRPAPNVTMQFISKFNPVWLEGSGVLTERVMTRTDNKGYVQIDLIRFGQYDVTIAGTEDYTRKISIPDQPNVNISDLLFPIVSAVTFTPAAPATMVVGDIAQLRPNVFSSDGNPVDINSGPILWSSSDPSILGVGLAGGILNLVPLAPGTAQVRGVRSDQSIIRIPDAGVAGLPFSVVVSP